MGSSTRGQRSIRISHQASPPVAVRSDEAPLPPTMSSNFKQELHNHIIAILGAGIKRDVATRIRIEKLSHKLIDVLSANDVDFGDAIIALDLTLFMVVEEFVAVSQN